MHRSPLDFWLLFGYDDVSRFLRDPTLSVEDRRARPRPIDHLTRELIGDRADRGQYAMLNRDPPDHTRLRRLVSKAFSPKALAALGPRVAALTDAALDRAAAAGPGRFDLIGDLAFPLPFTVISDMLGMPETDADRLRSWSGQLVRSLEPLFDPAALEAIAVAGDAMRAFLTDAIDWKRRHPSDDMLSALIAAEDEGEVLSDEELLEQILLLYVAGHETTVKLIGNGVLALVNHRDELEALVREPGLVAGAIDELLRSDSPVQMSRRITVADVDVGDHTIEAGSFVVLVLGSANRDQARWGETADDRDLQRAGAAQHLSFGGGAHYCLGASLARLEGRVAIGRLVERFPRLDLSGPPTWNGRINLRGLSSLPLSLCTR
ncbi:MAG: cytochrome P450 [Acidimicrobiales bacterium]